ncbi:MAG: ferredoxin family protein, partial [Lentisphaerae bacterium]|nr:ferredoxin family protein [Lentisphaerota bacterium]
TNCRQCLDFCLFGVYASDQQGRVAVERPANCKDNCPACARMCPALAIMFPKIDEDSPINGSDADAASASGKVCLTHDQLFGEHTLARLRARQRPPLFKQP